jgi:hypothetical protein
MENLYKKEMDVPFPMMLDWYLLLQDLRMLDGPCHQINLANQEIIVHTHVHLDRLWLNGILLLLHIHIPNRW